MFGGRTPFRGFRFRTWARAASLSSPTRSADCSVDRGHRIEVPYGPGVWFAGLQGLPSSAWYVPEGTCPCGRLTVAERRISTLAGFSLPDPLRGPSGADPTLSERPSWNGCLLPMAGRDDDQQAVRHASPRSRARTLTRPPRRLETMLRLVGLRCCPPWPSTPAVAGPSTLTRECRCLRGPSFRRHPSGLEMAARPS